jgi:flagellin
MGMVLNTNIGSIQAQRALTESRAEMEKAMERLSTGLRINSAADDAAGLAIVERMNTQIRGLTMATKNANDGIALIKTVENALVEVSGMLQRMRELSVQASNDTNTATERAFANNEISQLQLEISRVSLNTRYNGAQVLNGAFAAKTLQVGTESGETISFSIDTVESATLGAFELLSQTISPLDNAVAGTPFTGIDYDQDIIISAGSNSRTIEVNDNDSARILAKRINAVAGATGVTAEARTFAMLSTATAAPNSSARIKINGTETAAFSISSSDVSDAITKINAISATTGVQASATDDYKVLLSDKWGDTIKILNTSATRGDLKVQALGNDGETVHATTITMATSGSANDNATVLGTLRLTSATEFSVNLEDNATTQTEWFLDANTPAALKSVGEIGITTRVKASDAIAIIDGAIQKISSMRGGLGTLQNRLDYTVSNLMKVTEYTTGARSSIQDADFAAETARLAKAQVLQQAGAAMLSQANASTDVVLQIIRG